MKLIRSGLTLAAVLLVAAPVFAQQTGKLKCKVNPGRAGVFLDGKYLGPAANFAVARTYSVPAGEHELKLDEPRYKSISKKITVTAGKQTTVKEKMEALPVPKPPFGAIRTINNDKFAAVYLNDKFYGHVDEFSNGSQRLLVPPGTYEVRIVPASGAPIVQKITVEANKTVVVK
jgi:hypothetical protein